MCLPLKQFKQKIALPTSHRCRKEDSQKNPQKKPKLLQKGKYKYVNEMKNQHQSHCRLVEHIYQDDFSMKTCKQADESQWGWCRSVDPPMEEELGRRGWGLVASAGGQFMSLLEFLELQCTDAVLGAWKRPKPLSHERLRSGMRGKCCALVFMERTMSGKVSAGEQADTDSIL